MPNHDDTPAPRARRRLGRGPGGEPTPAEQASAEEVSAEQAPAVPVGSPVGSPEQLAADRAVPAGGPATGDRGGLSDGAGDGAAGGTTDGAGDGTSGATPVEAVEEGAEAIAAGAGAVGQVDGETGDETGGGPGSETSGETGGDGKFTLRLDNFEGPFDLLLQLISKHKLDVTEVALSKVTDEFMAHIRAMGPDWDLDQTTEFLVVAATLLDLKAARLLPAAEVEDEADLALLEARDLLFARLLQYRAYKRIADIFSDRLAVEARRYPRTVGLEPQHAELLPEVVISIGAEGFAKLAVKAMQPKAKPQVYVDHIHAPLVSVREQAEVLLARLREAGGASFQQLVADAPDTLTVVARFLALLELYRERVVALDQEEALGALTVRWTGAEGAVPVVTDEFDQEPGQQEPGRQESGRQERQPERQQVPGRAGRAEEEQV
ncbi:segregation/condensation protein A [Streptomyces sp. N2A]|uniref:segregation and condensation protein A n=1 Tax=Streptomyces sp. N2A TaxID=3073936 RepID=UPI00287084AB|nr:segregation/condensation protein A [Streptomyces sp. N2A]